MRKPHLRVWLGCGLIPWLKILVAGRFALTPSALPEVALTTIASLINSLLSALERVALGWRRIDRTILPPPIFIVGHWRTGTTLLHELLVLDPRHVSPNTYQCMVPGHFLLSERRLTRLLARVLPRRRPMDRMPVRWSGPQEDEFALCNLGLPSPYLMFAFPEQARRFAPHFDLVSLPEATRARWRTEMTRFFRRVTQQTPGRLVLKSPPHGFRIPLLDVWYPGALFINIVRHPHAVVPSTLRMLKEMANIHSLAKRRFDKPLEFALDNFLAHDQALAEARLHLPPERYHELRYEDLIADPVAALGAIYEHFGLGDFDAMAARIAAYFSERRGYRPNVHELPPELRATIDSRCRDYMARYDYAA
jgi:hypothetical protein